MTGCLSGSVLVAAMLIGIVQAQDGDGERLLETYTFKKNMTTTNDEAQFETYSTAREAAGPMTIAPEKSDDENSGSKHDLEDNEIEALLADIGPIETGEAHCSSCQSVEYSESQVAGMIFLFLFAMLCCILAYFFPTRYASWALRPQSYSTVTESDGGQRVTQQSCESNQQPQATVPTSDCTLSYLNEENSKRDGGLDPPPAYVSRCPSASTIEPPSYKDALNGMKSEEKGSFQA